MINSQLLNNLNSVNTLRFYAPRICLQVVRITNNSEVLEAWDLETWGTDIVPGEAWDQPWRMEESEKPGTVCKAPECLEGEGQGVTGESRKGDKDHSFQEAVTMLSYTWRLNP